MVVVDNNANRSACMDLDAIDYTLNGVCSKAATRDKDTAAAKVVNLTSDYNRIDININNNNNNNNSNGNSNITKGSNKNFSAKAVINHSNFVDIGRALITAAHMSNTNVANSSNSFQQLAQLQRSSVHLQHQYHPSQLHHPVSSIQLQQQQQQQQHSHSHQQQQQYHQQSNQFYQRHQQSGNSSSGNTNGANQINNTVSASSSSTPFSDTITTVANTGGSGNSGVSRNAITSNGPFYGGRLQFFKGISWR